MDNSLQLLSSVNLTRVVQALQYVTDLPGDLLFLSRHPVVPATDQEMLARFVGRVNIADIIMPDSEARVYSFGRWQTETTNLPKIKIGIGLSEAQIDMLSNLMFQGGPAVTDANSPLKRFFANMGEAVLLGIRQRWESLLVAAYCDDFEYNGLGIQLSGVKFGTPAELKTTVMNFWDNTGAADPVTDILVQKLVAQQRFGIVFNRMTLSQTAFLYMISTTAFQNRIRLFYGLNVPVTTQTLGVQTLERMRELAAPALGLTEIEWYDSRYWTQDTQGNELSARYLPVNKVLLSATMNDNRTNVLEVKNGIPAESKVAGLVPNNAVGELPRGEYGPVSYATPANANLNPPGATVWGAAKSWPQKIQQQMNACLTVGNFADTIPSGMAFPVL